MGKVRWEVCEFGIRMFGLSPRPPLPISKVELDRYAKLEREGGKRLASHLEGRKEKAAAVSPYFRPCENTNRAKGDGIAFAAGSQTPRYLFPILR